MAQPTSHPWRNDGARGGGLVLTDNELACLLIESAMGNAGYECPDAFCEACNRFNRLWWDVSNNLRQEVRIAFQRAMREHNIPFPDAPWDTVDPFTGAPVE